MFGCWPTRQATKAQAEHAAIAVVKKETKPGPIHDHELKTAEQGSQHAFEGGWPFGGKPRAIARMSCAWVKAPIAPPLAKNQALDTVNAWSAAGLLTCGDGLFDRWLGDGSERWPAH